MLSASLTPVAVGMPAVCRSEVGLGAALPLRGLSPGRPLYRLAPLSTHTVGCMRGLGPGAPTPLASGQR
jgi:hypothetical protein